MKKWLVTCQLTPRVFQGIHYPEVGDDTVEADYAKIDSDGSLIFRRVVRNGYPEIVHAYASGRWLEFREIV